MNQHYSVRLLALLFIPLLALSDDDRIAKLKQKMAESHRQDSLIESLTSQGLALSDAKMTAEKVALGLASCFIDAMVENAKEKSVPLDDLLDALESTLSNIENPETLALIDKEAVTEKAMPCAYQISQDAGINVL